jgi:diamine N-acetyltransferase
MTVRLSSCQQKMFINDDTISLRCAEPGDAQQIYCWENDRSVWRVSGTYAPFTQFHIEQFLLNNNDLFSQKQLRLMIDHTTTRESIGCIDIYDYDAINSRAGIGILIDKKYRRQGYAARALKLCLDYLFNDLLLHQAHCVIDETNIDSQRLFENQGFTLCGRRKDWIKTEKGFIDELEYQLMKSIQIL